MTYIVGWKHTLIGAKEHAIKFGEYNDKIRNGTFAPEDAPHIEAAAKAIAEAFDRFYRTFNAIEYRVENAIDFLTDETVGDDPEAYLEEAVNHLNNLYDFADHYRILVQ